MKLVISGASGWLGREFIYSLLRNEELKSMDIMRLFSSSKKNIDFGEFGVVQSEAFLEMNPKDYAGTETFVHLAFLTRDLVDKYGVKEFLAINQELTNKAVEFIKVVKPKYVVNVSSGAVFDRASGKLENSPLINPYGFGKLQEEKSLLAACEIAGSNISIGRLWGCTGEFMPINRAYALSDLIFTALTERRIRIKSKGRVIRRYCDAGEFMQLLHALSKENRIKVINSGGPKIEIGDLASLIARFVGDVSIDRELDPNSAEDDYYPRDWDYEESSKLCNLILTPIEEQVKRTILGHKNRLAALT